MVQSNVDSRTRTRRMKHSEEQAPLVESYLNSNSSTIYHGMQTGSIACVFTASPSMILLCYMYANGNKGGWFGFF